MRGTVGRGAKKKTEDEAGAAGVPAKASPKKAVPKDEVTAATAKLSAKTVVPKDEVIRSKTTRKTNRRYTMVCCAPALEARVGGNENPSPESSD